MNLELHATPQEVMRAVEALEQLGQERQVPERALFGLTLALEECGSNIVNHALRSDASQTFRVAIEITGGVITIELRDRGPEFDPTQPRAEKPPDEDGAPGGWGLELARRHTTSMSYRREGGENVLRLSQTLGAPAARN